MALTESVLNEESISLLLMNEYNILSSHIERLESGSANIYKIADIYGALFILKEMQPEMTEKKILKEYSICKHIILDGVSVPEYVITRSGKCFCNWHDRFLVLQKYIRGITLPSFGGSWKCTQRLAELYAMIINSPYFVSMELPQYDKDFFGPEKILGSIANHKELIDSSGCKLKNEVEKKIYWLEEIFDSDLLDLHNITFANSHGDYTIFQCIYNEGGDISAVVDFLSAKNMPIILELVRSFVYAYEKNSYSFFDVDALCRYIKVFQEKSLIKLSFYDIKYLIYPYYLRLLCSTFCFNCLSEQCYKIASHLFSQCEFMHNYLCAINKKIMNNFK